MGVSVLPKFAAMVSNTIKTMAFSCLSNRCNRVMVNGTVIISATSLVTNILKKKQVPTKQNARLLIFLAFVTKNLDSESIYPKY